MKSVNSRMPPEIGKRERFQIFAEILTLCRVPKAKTHIMYEANLSYSQLQKFLKQLQDLDFLNCRREKEYITTERGLSFIQKYIDLQLMLGEDAYQSINEYVSKSK